MQKKEDQGYIHGEPSKRISLFSSPLFFLPLSNTLLPSSLNLFPRRKWGENRGTVENVSEEKKERNKQKKEKRKERKKEEMEETSNPRVLSVEEKRRNVGRLFTKNFFVSRRKEKVPAN